MQLTGAPKIFLRKEARDLIDLYASLGERAESFLPRHIVDNLRNFVRLCNEEPTDPAKQQAEINRYILEFNEDLPGYVSVSLMLMPHKDSKAFAYNAEKLKFRKRLQDFMDTESLTRGEKEEASHILHAHDFSVGTPPVTEDTIAFLSKIILGDTIRDLRKFRDVIGITGDIEEAHWNYFMDTALQMVVQSTHYTTTTERDDFLHRTEWAVNFKGLNGLIRAVVSGNAQTAADLLTFEVLGPHNVQVVDKISADDLYEQMEKDSTRVFIIKVPHMRKNIYGDDRWFQHLARMVFVDDSPESRSSNTSLVFALHNGLINTLNKVHTKKLGAPANTQLNLRLILENVNMAYVDIFKDLLRKKIADYNRELHELAAQHSQPAQNTSDYLHMAGLDSFTRQILADRYALKRLLAYLEFTQNTRNPEKHTAQNEKLIQTFEERVKKYFYSDHADIQMATILEGGGRNQIKTYGEFLLQKKLPTVGSSVAEACNIILEAIPDNFKRTLHIHFHKNFGINLFLEKYQEHLIKTDNSGDNKGRFNNFLRDLGMYEAYHSWPEERRRVVREFLARLGNLDKTSIADDVQMIVRDLVLNNQRPKPYIIYNEELGWEYKDLFPEDRFAINPFGIEIEITSEGRSDYQRLQQKLQRIKSTLALFDDSGSLWDVFCENTTLLINDPSNPTGYSDFNTEHLIALIQFLNNSRLTLFLDEAYTDGVKINDPEEPKWRSVSRYIFNNSDNIRRLSMVASLSTTKNLAATGNRLGALVASPARADAVAFARSKNPTAKGNSNSLYFLNNILETARYAKKLKDSLDEQLPKDASRNRMKHYLEQFIKERAHDEKTGFYADNTFVGSPLHMFLLDELVALNKLDILGVPDDFKYRGEPFFIYWKKQVVKKLNQYRVNRIFRTEANKRLTSAKKIAARVLEEEKADHVRILHSDGSYLFNIRLTHFPSYADLEQFLKALAANRGIALLPYSNGVIRFALGNFLKGGAESYKLFYKELENALRLFLRYWQHFNAICPDRSAQNCDTQAILQEIFGADNERMFFEQIREDYTPIRGMKRQQLSSLFINDVRSLYHASPASSGISINTVGNSKNSVIEFQGDIGRCPSIESFINSRAFTKVYENLLAQIYHKIPDLRNLDFNTIASKYGKATILKYISNKKQFKPTHFVLDDPDEMNIMREILIEMENLLFSDAKTKILAIDAQGNPQSEKSQMEGINRVLKKYIEEILLHFNLPFARESIEPSRREIIHLSRQKLEEFTGLSIETLDLDAWFANFIDTRLRQDGRFRAIPWARRAIGQIVETIKARVLNAERDTETKILYFYLFKNDNSLPELLIKKMQQLDDARNRSDDEEIRLMADDLIEHLLHNEVQDIVSYIRRKRDIKISANELDLVTQRVVLFFIDLINQTQNTRYYEKYTHLLIKMVRTAFRKQYSSVNEMFQHGISVYRNFSLPDNHPLITYNNGQLSWINQLLSQCGVISTEQPVQLHTRIVTDAKKREYPFHKADFTEAERLPEAYNRQDGNNAFVKRMDARPQSDFFARRLADFAQNLDTDDYRCKITRHGLFNELYIFQKSYMKYLTDNYRLLMHDTIGLDELEDFVPDIITFYGAPEKVISFPQIGYFDIKGPAGNIKTIVTPLKKEVDYFGDIKKPRLTMINEKVKEMGGIPIHGSLFAVEEEDGSLFVIAVGGDSGVGKSEMLAAMMLKLLKENLPGIRSITQIAGDMFHVFRDDEGQLFGVGTEVGDFSRVTDFDPDFIENYRYLFESSADSNVEDLNSRSTVSGLCRVEMPYRIDIMLTASNFARQEAGITRVDNPENFLLYVDSHGERKEKATSQDGPNLARSLMRYTADPTIVDVLARHGNYIDEVLDWDEDAVDGKHYLAASYKRMDKIDIEELVNAIFKGKTLLHQDVSYTFEEVRFDIIRNRFVGKLYSGDDTQEVLISRKIFSQLFESLASTPAGQPFIAEEGQLESRQYLIDLLKGGENGQGKGKRIQCGILSTELGREGKEISGPQQAAASMVQLIQEVRIKNPEINSQKNYIRKLLREKYAHIFSDKTISAEIWRYNHLLYQYDEMRKARFVRTDKPKEEVDLSRLKGFEPKSKKEAFSPLLVTPNVNIELDGFAETYRELMSLPNYSHFTQEFVDDADSLYVAEGYAENTQINNMMIQLLLMGDYIDIDDLSRGRIPEKVNRETIAAAKYAVMRKMGKLKEEKPTAESRDAEADKPDETNNDKE